MDLVTKCGGEHLVPREGEGVSTFGYTVRHDHRLIRQDAGMSARGNAASLLEAKVVGHLRERLERRDCRVALLHVRRRQVMRQTGLRGFLRR